MLSVLNKLLFSEVPNSRSCDEFSVIRTAAPPDCPLHTKGSWESLNAKAELARMHRDGQCQEAVMWYVHHLPESMKTPTRRLWPIPDFSGISRDEKVQKLRARLISSELTAHQTSPSGVTPHWRSRPALELETRGIFSTSCRRSSMRRVLRSLATPDTRQQDRLREVFKSICKAKSHAGN